MQGSERAKAFAHLISFTALSALLILCGTFFPVIGFICMLAASTPLALLGCLDGAAFLCGGILLLEMVLFAAFSPLLALYAAMGCVPLSITIYFISLNYNLKNKYAPKIADSGGAALILCASSTIISKLILLVTFRFLTGRNILIPDSTQLEAVLSQLGGGVDTQELRASLMQSIALMPYILPSILIVYSSFEAVVNYVLCAKFLKKHENKKLPALPPFQDWGFPVSILPVLIFTFVTGFFVNTENWFEGAMFLINLRLILNAIFIVQGMAFAFWWMSWKNFGRTARIVLTVFLLFPLMWLWLILLGVSDMAFNFRGRLNNKNNKDNKN